MSNFAVEKRFTWHVFVLAKKLHPIQERFNSARFNTARMFVQFVILY